MPERTSAGWWPRRQAPGLRSRDLWTGLLFLAVGVFAVATSLAYPMGTAARMGPGYFPTVLGGILALIGLAYTGRGLWAGGDAVGRWHARPLFLVLGSVVAFAGLISQVGLVLTTAALVLLSSLGGWEFRLRDAVLLALALAVLVVAVFAYGLGLPLQVWPR